MAFSITKLFFQINATMKKKPFQNKQGIKIKKREMIVIVSVYNPCV